MRRIAVITGAAIAITMSFAGSANAFVLAEPGIVIVDNQVDGVAPYTTTGNEWVVVEASYGGLSGDRETTSYSSPDGVEATVTIYASGKRAPVSRVFRGGIKWGIDPTRTVLHGYSAADRCNLIRAGGELQKIKNGAATCKTATKTMRRFLLTKRAPTGWKCKLGSTVAACTKNGKRVRAIETTRAEINEQDVQRSREVHICGQASGISLTSPVFTARGRHADCAAFSTTAGRIMAHYSIYKALLYQDGEWVCDSTSNGYGFACGNGSACMLLTFPEGPWVHWGIAADEDGAFTYLTREMPRC